MIEKLARESEKEKKWNRCHSDSDFSSFEQRHLRTKAAAAKAEELESNGDWKEGVRSIDHSSEAWTERPGWYGQVLWAQLPADARWLRHALLRPIADLPAADEPA